MSGSETLLEDGLRFQSTLQQDLKSLMETLGQQLLETEVSVLRHNKELDKRIQQNAVLWPQQGASSKTAKDQKYKYVFIDVFYSFSLCICNIYKRCDCFRRK